MTPTAAARASQSSSPTLRDRLKDPSLVREHCYIDGAWVGTPALPVTNPASGAELARVPQMSAADATKAVEAAERAFQPGRNSLPSNAPTSCVNGTS
jgi:succinate-semialdehyde dehydrogenase / glutarate-semialdehyde dehydrogenase